MAKRRLSKVEKSYIENSKDSVEDIAKELDRPVPTIVKYQQEWLAAQPKEVAIAPQTVENTAPDPTKLPDVIDMMKVKVGENRSVIVMTDAVAQRDVKPNPGGVTRYGKGIAKLK